MLTILQKVAFFIKKWLRKQASSVNHKDLITDVYKDIGISPGYFATLTLANLIALNGLIQNSAAVIIGAMLISPLMGPILSFGFAFITGDRLIWKKSIEKITMSVALTIAVAAVVTYLSPLKDITNEIISRTRPNLYDLIIAFLAGTAGAMAICTKKNYLTIVPGVAIATAVIPPLSVSGFGLGIWNWKILGGGFFLFFTNFVAVIISTIIVFYIYGFKPSTISENNISALKKRIAYLAVILLVISIPLIYTLQISISEVKLRSDINEALKLEFNKAGRSRIFSFNYFKKKDASLEIDVIVNSIDYLKDSEINDAEKRIKEYLKHDLKLYVEQVKVQPGGLKETIVKTPVPAIAPPKPPQEIIRSSRESIIGVVKQSSEKVEKIMSPSTIADFYAGFHDKAFKVSIAMKIKRDTPITEEEVMWLKRIFATDLTVPVDISVETIPFVPLLIFQKGETALSDEMKKALSSIKDVYSKDPDIKIVVTSYTGSPSFSGKRKKLAEERAKQVAGILGKDYSIPSENISIVMLKSKKIEAPAVKITVTPQG